MSSHLQMYALTENLWWPVNLNLETWTHLGIHMFILCPCFNFQKCHESYFLTGNLTESTVSKSKLETQMVSRSKIQGNPNWFPIPSARKFKLVFKSKSKVHKISLGNGHGPMT